jgi:membrane protein
MASLLTLIILTTFFHIYYFVTKRKYRKYGDSPIYRKIDLIYLKWYRFYGFLLNRRNMTVYDINKLLHHLKNDLVKVGISKQDIESYIEVITNNKKELHLGIKDIVIWVLSFITTNSIFTDIINDNKEPIIKNIQEYLSTPGNITTIIKVTLVCLLIIMLINMLWIFTKFGTINTVHKESQRLFSLNGLVKIWDYQVDTSVKKLEDIDPSRLNIVYSELNITKTTLDNFVDNTIGSDTPIYLNSLIDQLIDFLNKIGSWLVTVLKILIVLVIPNIFGILLSVFFSLTGFIIFYAKDTPIGLKIILIVLFLFFTVITAMLYLSFFKMTLETHKSQNAGTSGSIFIVNRIKDLSGINWIQILLSSVLYIYLANIGSTKEEILGKTILIPIVLIIYSIFWTPNRNME